MTHDDDAPDRYAVMGNPVSHSRSPAIHRMFAAQLGDRIEYTAIQVEPGGFAQAVEQFRVSGGRGLNVTVPFKLEAYQLADSHTPLAQQAQAANVLRFAPDGALEAHNTDGPGLVRDLMRLLGIGGSGHPGSSAQDVFRGRRMLVLGAGGAVRGVLAPLLAGVPASVVVANRTVERARDLERLFGAGRIRACGYSDLAGHSFDIIINGTSASLGGEVPPLPAGLFNAGALAYDMMYGDRSLPFLDWAQRSGAASVSDGLGMLVEQAAESYHFWRGRFPDTVPVLAALRLGTR
ncbi:MAG: shikimate dehydrogenase [Pseudomonadota bacterium]|nr:shikimate dehydrogenase [Pseudomonadota bacterium]